VGGLQTANNLRSALEKDWQHMNKHARKLHKDLYTQLDSAISAAQNTAKHPKSKCSGSRMDIGPQSIVFYAK
jgi:hypothetical protein